MSRALIDDLTTAPRNGPAFQAPASRKGGFGLGQTMSVLCAFMAIHTWLALRVPLTHLESDTLLPMPGLLLDLPFLLASLGQSLAPGPMAQRAAFVIVSALTSLAVFAAARRLTQNPLAPALAVIWLNTTVLFGVGSVLATREALGALGLALGLMGLTGARRTPSILPWLAALAGLAITATSLPAAALAFLGAPLAMVTDEKARRWLGQTGFGVFFGLALVTVWAGYSGLRPVTFPSAPQSVALGLLIAFGPGVLFFAAIGLAAPTGLARGAPKGLAVPAGMVAALLLAAATGAAAPTDLTMLAPIVCVAAAVCAAASTGFVRDRVLEMATPFAFLGMLLAIYVCAVPTNSFLPRLPWLSGLFGWQGLAVQVEREATRANAAYVLVGDRAVARALGEALSRPVLFTDPRTIWAVPNCELPGLFVSRETGASELLGNFRNITRRSDAPRMAGAWAVDLFTIYAVAEPTARSGCPLR